MFDAYLRFFSNRHFTGRWDSFRHIPTGPAYARRAFAKHGALPGFVLTAERLVAPRIRRQGNWRIYDPVEANDRWWHKLDAAGIGDSC